jgi:hypothetical protein
MIKEHWVVCDMREEEGFFGKPYLRKDIVNASP